MLIAQISDMHVKPEGALAYRRVETTTLLARCIDQICRMTPRPDVVLATGDLVDGGRSDEYARLRGLLAPLPMPVYLIPGNHDEREALGNAFADHPYLPRGDAFIQYVIDRHPVRLVALDTLVPGKASGLLCEQRIAWLAARLVEAPERPTVIFMHHPPFTTGIQHMDRIGLEGARAMGDVVKRHPQVEAVLCGHLHRPIQVRWCGTLASTAPSTAHQVVLDLGDGGRPAFTMEPPAFLVHRWEPGTGLVSHTSYVGDFAGPYPFFDAGHLID